MMQQFVNGEYLFFMREKSLIMCSDKGSGSFKPSFCVVLSSYFSRNCSSSKSFLFSFHTEPMQSNVKWKMRKVINITNGSCLNVAFQKHFNYNMLFMLVEFIYVGNTIINYHN